MKKLLLLLPVTLFLGLVSGAQDIIPAPQNRTLKTDADRLIFTDKITINDPGKHFAEEVEVMQQYFRSALNIELDYTTGKAKKPFITLLQTQQAQSESYSMELGPKGGSISGSAAGVFYGLQSLLQLAQVKGTVISFQSQQITDFPSYSWRGLHLDVCRHFFPVSYVRKYIDLMARHKLNTFHWHLTDDQGWRIEIKKYPELTRKGGWRNRTMVGQYRDNAFDTLRYGGSYTQEEITEIVDYARKRHVTVVPEIEMPGHAVAAISAYPFLGCSGKQIPVEGMWGVFTDVFCAGNDSVFTFLENVLDEVVELFPGEYIHIGGDECPKDSWKTCPKCQLRIRTEKLKDEHELQSYFIRRIEKHLNGKGRKIIGWDEILEGGLAPNAAVMSWRGTEGAIASATQDHPAVLTPGSHCYFDHYQGDPAWEPISIGGMTTLKKVYSFNPLPEGLPEDKKRYILGGQANHWSEYILSEAHMDYMVWPRACALSEALWLSAEKKNEPDFMRRLTPHLLQLQKEGVNLSWSHYRPKYLTNISEHRPGISVTPSTSDKVVLEYIPANLSGLPIKKAVIKPDSLLETCTALGSTYKGKFVSLPGSGQVVFYSGPNYLQKDTLNVNFSLSSGAKIKWITPPASTKADAAVLVDGLTDDRPFYEQRWIRFDTSAVSIELDLGDENLISSVKIGQLNEPHNNIFPATILEVEVSTDGTHFTHLVPTALEATSRNISLRIMNHKARFLRIKASGIKRPGKTSMLFDEISVN
ncbi:MAG: family 20 glycosylhydrolase [Bacteroidota bacterium]